MKKSISDGGITYGNSHEEGGIKVRNNSTNEMLEVEGGEAVINKRSMASDKKVKLNGKNMSVCEAVSELNELEGGVKLECSDVEDKQFLAEGGSVGIGEVIKCKKCNWTWNTKDSEEYDKYVCHKCGFDNGDEIESLISKGVVELKFYETTAEHAKEFGIKSKKPLYVQNLCVSENERLKGIGKKVLNYLEDYARKNGNDVIFGYLATKASFTKDSRQSFFCDVDMIKNWLHNNQYAINGENNDFHKVIFKQGGELKKGIKTEREHFDTLNLLYKKKITPNEALKVIAEEHIAENPKYYSELMKIVRDRKCGCGCTTKYDSGGMFNNGIGGGLEGFIKGELKRTQKKTEEEQVIEDTITRSTALLDFDYLPLLKSNLPDNLKIYVAPVKSVNLYKLGWRTQFGSSREWAGLCSYKAVKGVSEKQKDLFLSIQFTKWDRNWRDNLDDVILHEIAHAIVNEVFKWPLGFTFDSLDPYHKPTEGHGKIWESVCSAINLSGGCSQYYRNKDLKDDFKFFKYQCGYCGDVKFSNAKSFATNCFRCLKPVIVQKNK